jgi:hypothetical protein
VARRVDGISIDGVSRAVVVPVPIRLDRAFSKVFARQLAEHNIHQLGCAPLAVLIGRRHKAERLQARVIRAERSTPSVGW